MHRPVRRGWQRQRQRRHSETGSPGTQGRTHIVVGDRRDAGLGYSWVWPDKKTKDAAADIEAMVEAL
jgi:hypothetical protein